MKDEASLSVKKYIGYGVTDMFSGGVFALISAWLLYFYVTFCGLTPIEAGSILFIARILDTIISPVMGYITDNFGHTKLGKKFGRRRFFLLLGCPLMAIFSLMWIDNMGYFYYLTIYLLVEILAAMIIIPYEALASEMTSNYGQRTRLSAARIIFGGLGTFLATFIPGRLFALYGSGSAKVFFATGVVFTLISMTVIFITWLSTWERPAEPQQTRKVKKKDGSLLSQLKHVFTDLFSTLRVRSFRQHLMMYIFSFTAMDMLSAVFTFYVVFALNQNATLAANLMSVGIFCFGWVTALFAWGFIRFTPSRMLQLCYSMVILCMLGYTAFYFYPSHWMIPALYIISFIYQVFKGGYVYLSWNIYPFIPDVDEVMSTRRREGVFAGMMTFVRKSTLAISTLLIGFLLQMNGFVSNSQSQSQQAIDTIVGIVSIGSISMLAGCLFISFRFRLNNHNHQLLLLEIARLKATDGDKTGASAETRDVLEQLTGYPYEALWNPGIISGKVAKRSNNHLSTSLNVEENPLEKH